MSDPMHDRDFGGIAAPTAGSEKRMVCPKCGFEQKQAEECLQCGVFVRKFVEHQRMAEEARLIDDTRAKKAEIYSPKSGAATDNEFFAPEKKGLEKGMLGGIAMMAIAVIWFGLGWMAGYIFFYPPILFVIGLFGFLKGIFAGNVAG